VLGCLGDSQHLSYVHYRQCLNSRFHVIIGKFRGGSRVYTQNSKSVNWKVEAQSSEHHHFIRIQDFDPQTFSFLEARQNGVPSCWRFGCRQLVERNVSFEKPDRDTTRRAPQRRGRLVYLFSYRSLFSERYASLVSIGLLLRLQSLQRLAVVKACPRIGNPCRSVTIRRNPCHIHAGFVCFLFVLLRRSA
jgi:hypothetical protein